jgi:hypothetical protein
VVGASAVLLAIVFSVAAPGWRTYAQELPPRPVPPPVETPAPPPEPPAPPAEAPAAEEPARRTPQPQPLGAITGTVINAANGAPTPGVYVYVGGQPVVSDANGNYVRNGLPPGRYTVWVGGPRGMFVAVEPLQVVEVAGGATVVAHLAVARP